MKRTHLLTAALALAASLFAACSDDATAQNPEKSNRDKAVELLKSIETGASEPVAYINPTNYKQHNLTIADGLAGFGEALAELADYPEAAKVNTVRAFTDGDYVVLHTDYNFFGPKIGFDVFRFENGLIVEHWDNLITTPATPNPSGHSMTDGTTTVTDRDRTAENKTLVENFVKDVLMGEHPEKLNEYFDGNNYIQHNPAIADGLDGLSAALADMAARGVVMRYDRIHKVLGEGNFVLAISEGAYGENGGEPTSYYDLFRVENGKIAEHWDVMETIAPQADWKNQNGKFNF